MLGTERRTPPVAPRPGQDAPSALLDAAALSTVRRRAGLRPAPARPGPDRAPEDPRPALPTAARSRLALLLADRSAPGRGGSRSAPDLAELLPQWLALANHHGYRVPDALLPALLDAARARTDLRAEALTLGGPRALWLARLNPDWRFALRGAAGRASASPPEPSEAATAPDEEQRLWEEGLFAERVSLLATARHRDPAAGLALLSGTWSTERAEDRLMFLDSLRDDLSPSDEPFLEQALSDRSRNVRATAAELLSALPGSALAARMAERSRGCVSLTADEPPADALTTDGLTADALTTDGLAADALTTKGLTPDGLAPDGLAPDGLAPDGLTTERLTAEGSTAEGSIADGLTGDEPTAAGRTPRITVRPPDECDSGMQRDGIVPKPPSGRGARSWWLGQLVEATPLDRWSEWFGGRAPAEIVALPVADGWQADLHAAWCRAAVRQRGAEWCRALLGTPAVAPVTAGEAAPAAWRDPAKLLSALPSQERAEWVAEFIASHGLSDAFRLLGVCAVPWAQPLGRAVVDALDIARDAGSYPWSFSGVMGLAERCLDPTQADRLEVLTAIPDEREGAAPGAGGYWAEAFQRLVGTLRLRAAMQAELAPA
ncbi:DUF5691 domain-containing protein [Streptomyces sp. RCU064]|uniref:DUF5691 domain-containing protein n=1 Tax=Streptomyces rugosispiralis TaxID=2967341 RepID=A0ABT1UW39_9ACTN|nr:DUF5691 domain-containing protein [Streptomyces rugosispiralis]MCQ8189216.1 DUF5691 domain-containing protein [Streptomyces rugosispiralis]